jgi:phytoene synthase
MRLVDDIADDEELAQVWPQDRRAALDYIQAKTRQAVEGGADPRTPEIEPVLELWPAFVAMVRQYQVPWKVFEEMIAGQKQDLEPAAIPNFAALHQYCYRVASVVGVASLYVFGFEGGEDTLRLGADRGIAFQLTNILRDLREDAAPPRRRCYLPADELAQFGVTPEALARGTAERGFPDLMARQIKRAREFYDRSAALEARVHADARPTLAAMTGIYRGILERIAARPEAVLRGRVRLSAWAKLRIAWQALRGRRNP